MTAEVAVLNKSAVALAADSAMTVGKTGKTYPTNKLFALTKYRPIGVMVYNNAEFMGVPWETLVKMHREESGLDGRATVKDYAEHFLGWLCRQRSNLYDRPRASESPPHRHGPIPQLGNEHCQLRSAFDRRVT